MIISIYFLLLKIIVDDVTFTITSSSNFYLNSIFCFRYVQRNYFAIHLLDRIVIETDNDSLQNYITC